MQKQQQNVGNQMLLRGSERYLTDRETVVERGGVREGGRVRERQTDRQRDRRTCGVSKTFVAAT